MLNKINSKFHSQGFSLISMMIALLIGIFIIAVAGKVYLKSKSSFNARSAVSNMTENGRFAIQDLRRTLIMAGMEIRASEANVSAVRSIPPLATGGTAVASGSETSLDAVAAADSDTIAVRYRRGPSCAGDINLAYPSAPATVRFLVANDQLMCQVSGGTQQPLVSGVKVMRVLYGVDDSSDGYADRYLDATQVDAFGKWVNIVAVRVGLIVDSGEYRQSVDMRNPVSYNLSLLGKTYTVPAKNEKTYKVFTTTIQLRNLNAVMQKQ